MPGTIGLQGIKKLRKSEYFRSVNIPIVKLYRQLPCPEVKTLLVWFVASFLNFIISFTSFLKSACQLLD